MLDAFKKLISKSKQQRWDREYRNGKWEYLHSLRELGHNSILAGYAGFLGVETVLDVGCGNGNLPRLLNRINFYVGIDISPIALAQLRELMGDEFKYQLIEANFDNFTPTDLKVDLVIFNESLYYSKNPYKTLQSYVQTLAPDGRIAISMFENSRATEVWDAVDQLFETIDKTSVTIDDKTWACRLLIPHSS
ncbi:MAG: class I SAM-dependent methyltransferase [Gammaproteobacteria bacterium]|nr:class I SAM-dependent methyltransferase [Gammaproteobacteria bacterium]